MVERADFSRLDHWVIKIGSAVFLDDSQRLDRRTIADLVYELASLRREGLRITIVSSGAVALGRERLGWPEPERQDIPYLQALAALGQSRLISMYEDEFDHYGDQVSQILFTRGDLGDRRRFLNARMTLNELHCQGIIPIINENDTVATDELKFGDNDRLAGMTCGVVDADLLVLLTTVEGIFQTETKLDADGAEKTVFTERICKAEATDSRLDEAVVSKTSRVGSGGMQSKVEAARTASRLGIDTVIANGKRTGRLEAIYRGKDVGTHLSSEPQARGLTGKKRWLGSGANPVGSVRCDRGAREAIETSGASLLPSGIIAVEGDFEEGDVVNLYAEDNQEPFARGLAVYPADHIRKIMGHQSTEIEGELGYKILDSVIHRDTLVVL